MPKKRAGGESLLEGALGALALALTSTGAPWMIIGGIAVIAHGVRRFTTDIDAAVRGDAISVDLLVDALERHEIIPRIPNASTFARENLVLLARHAPTGVDLDVSLAWSTFEHDAIEAAERTAFGSVQVPMSTAEDLVVFKAIAGRPRDIDDAESLLVLHPRIDVERARGRVAELAALADAPELLDGFDAFVARARGNGAAKEPKRRTVERTRSRKPR